jgi:N-carbamoylputrescine amidase
MALGGADILIYPTAIGWFDEDSSEEKQRQLDAWINIQKGHAIANGLPLVAINRVGKEVDDKKQIGGIRFWGNSFALGSMGEIIRQASNDKEEVIVFEINLNKSKETRKIWPFFRDRRVDSYGNLNKIFIDN